MTTLSATIKPVNLPMSTDCASLLTAEDLSNLRRNLRRWYQHHARDLPWRQAGDAYRVWISEIMLQQTTVAAVVPYYERFIARFPSVANLAAADEEEVLRMWEGLGYYSRARNIHKAARKIAIEFDGRFPADVHALRELPGIGRYTAGAIASFAFDRRAPIVEANTLRLYCRLLGYDGDPRSATGQEVLWSFARRLVPKQRPGQFNQALMDIGATVCTASDPDCPHCPLRTVCLALAEGRVDEIPMQKERIEMTEVVEASIAVHRRGAYLLRRRGDKERWAGLWDFLRFEVADGGPKSGDLSISIRRSFVDSIRDVSGVEVEVPSPVDVLRHSVTRYRITLHCLHAVCRKGRLLQSKGPMAWVKPADFDRYPLSVTGRRFARILSQKPAAT